MAWVDAYTHWVRRCIPSHPGVTSMKRYALVLSAVLPLVIATDVAAQAPRAPSAKTHKIAVGGEGGWDYLTVDAAAQRLYVSRGNRIVVVDTDSEKVIGELTDTPGVHGVALVPD